MSNQVHCCLCFASSSATEHASHTSIYIYVQNSHSFRSHKVTDARAHTHIRTHTCKRDTPLSRSMARIRQGPLRPSSSTALPPFVYVTMPFRNYTEAQPQPPPHTCTATHTTFVATPSRRSDSIGKEKTQRRIAWRERGPMADGAGKLCGLLRREPCHADINNLEVLAHETINNVVVLLLLQHPLTEHDEHRLLEALRAISSCSSNCVSICTFVPVKSVN